MTEAQRREKIIELLLSQPFASVRDLQTILDVSAATIRRDIDRLHEMDLARKVYGGVAALDGVGSQRSASALPFIENRDIEVEAKTAIAREAATLVKDGSLIIIHGGSTCFHFGCQMAQRNVRVFTNSMPLAAFLSTQGVCQLTVGGGDLHREPGILYDASGSGYTFYGSQFFIGALGVGPDGLLETHPLLVRFVNEMSVMANEIIVLVDSRKFSARPPTVALPLSRVNTLVTDDRLSDSDARMIEDAGINLIIAETAKASGT